VSFDKYLVVQMGSLLEEYRRRHHIDCIWPVNEGVLFFDQGDKPSVIAITSSFTKQLHVCPACPQNTHGICLEIFRRYGFPMCLQRVTHTHMPPDADLLEYIRNHVPQGEKSTAYICKSERDQERWLWEFFLATEPFRGVSLWDKFMASYKPEDPELFWVEQALWTISNLPEHFRQFYENIYSICMVNRRYILMD
jgi:hypothetical protein